MEVVAALLNRPIAGASRARLAFAMQRLKKQGRTTDSYQYASARRSNLPTEQTEPLMGADDKAPRPFTPAGRERDDEPVLAWSREALP